MIHLQVIEEKYEQRRRADEAIYTLNPQFISHNFKRLLHSDGSARNIT
jgi:hypothetical protein